MDSDRNETKVKLKEDMKESSYNEENRVYLMGRENSKLESFGCNLGFIVFFLYKGYSWVSLTIQLCLIKWGIADLYTKKLRDGGHQLD